MEFTTRKPAVNRDPPRVGVGWALLPRGCIHSLGRSGGPSPGHSRAIVTGKTMEPVFPCDRPPAPRPSSSDRHSRSHSGLPGEDAAARARGPSPAQLCSCGVNPVGLRCELERRHGLCVTLAATRPRGWGRCSWVWHLGFLRVFPVPGALWWEWRGKGVSQGTE